MTPSAPPRRPRGRTPSAWRGLDARVAAVDASAYFSRPGPRLVDGIELLGHLLHPERIDRPPPGRFAWLDLHSSAGVS